jgi:glucose-6-phosphate isomerase
MTEQRSSRLGPAIDRRIRAWSSDHVAERLWAKDGSLWASSGVPGADLAAWLGWLDLPEAMRERVGELRHLAEGVWRDGYTRAAVLGMGGSSLAPELFSRVFADPAGANGASPENGQRPVHAGGAELRILDSTHPDAVRGFREWATAARTLFMVSSKSGGTTEPNAFHAAMADVAPALDFLAITDPGSPLQEVARSQEFRGIVEAPPDVGGRYSALSVFGLVPAAIHGIDLDRLLARAASMAEACRQPASENPGLRLGAAIGEAARAGRDKLTILTSPRLAAFGDWMEQLIAESTGKAGKGIIPIVGEPIGDPAAYGDDRYLVVLTLSNDPATEVNEFAAEMARRGQPGQHLELVDAYDVGAQFVLWEVATAAAGMVLGIDPFDQPNVQESKDATKALLAAFSRDGALREAAPLVAETGIAASGDPAVLGDTPVTVEGAVRTLLGLVRPGDYVATLAYLPRDPGVEELLQGVRAGIRDRLRVATTLGFGPRFLHSTGQLHKGGPATGVFLQITAEPHRDLPIPGWTETFGTLIAAQALGDLESLQRRGRRVLRLHLSEPGRLERVAELVSAALPPA